MLNQFQPIELISVKDTDLDAKYNELLNEDNITKARKAGDKLVEGLTSEQYKQIRILCKTELFYLTTAVLGYKRLSPNLHGHLSEWYSKTRHCQYREILLPRGHFKSTELTIAGSIQDILPDDTNSLPWPYCLGTNCRLLIAHETDKQAQKFLFAITQHFLSNPLLMALYPECIPNPRKQVINKSELELPRTEFWPEPTIDTMGVGGKSQGRHYNILKLDDLFGDKARDSAAERETTIQWFDNVQSFFSTFAKDCFDLIGTRWSRDDLYDHVHKVYEDQIVKYIRPLYEYRYNCCGELRCKCGKLGGSNKVFIFPEEFDDNKVKILAKNVKVFSAQYLNDPKEGANKFDPNWKQFYTWEDTANIKYRVKGESEYRFVNIWNLDRCILIDPATTGEYGYVVTGMDQRDRKFILKAIQHVWDPAEFMDYLFRDVMRFQPRVVGIEEVLFSTLYQIWCNREQAYRNQKFTVVPLKVKKRQDDKRLRVEALSPYFSNYEIWFHESQHEILEQFDYFGSIQNYHALDALAHGPQVWRKPVPDFIRDSLGTDTKEQERDETYGYSQI